MPKTHSIRNLLKSRRRQSRAAPDRVVTFFPTAAYFSEDCWHIPIHGWIYTPAQQSRMRRAALRLIGRLLRNRLPSDDRALALFKRRAGAFLTDNQRNARIHIRIAGDIFRLKRSLPDGHFRSLLKIPADRLATFPNAESPWLEFASLINSTPLRRSPGRTLLLPPTGLSVISDIDDTLKITEVIFRRQMLRNTFLRPFSPVTDMAAVYQRWHQSRGAAFHYVSGSPWHLFPLLDEFLSAQQFPAGTFHLRDFRLMPRDLPKTLRPAHRIKSRHIRELLRRFPQRRFILVGDSGESDPETYGRLFRRFPNQIEKICIRNIRDQPSADRRWKKAFADIPAAQWQRFTHAHEIF